MISKVGQIMLYVDNQDEAVKFWTDIVGFQILSEADHGEGLRWIEIAPSKDAETSFVLHNKELVAKMSPELHLGTPSLLFFTEDLDQFYKHLASHEVTLGDIVTMPTGRVFNFADNEGNYFAILEARDE